MFVSAVSVIDCPGSYSTEHIQEYKRALILFCKLPWGILCILTQARYLVCILYIRNKKIKK